MAAHKSFSERWARLGGIDWMDKEVHSETDHAELHHARITGYDAAQINRLGWLPFFTPWAKGTVITCDLLFYVAFYLIVTAAFAYNAFDHTASKRRELYDLFTHLLEHGPLSLSTIVIFPLGLYTSIVVNRFLGTASDYNNVLHSTVDVAVNISTLATPKDNSDFTDQLLFLRATALRLLKLGQRLSLLSIMKKECDDDAIAELITAGYLRQDEAELLRATPKKFTHVYRSNPVRFAAPELFSCM